jgi:hypothetical protein
MIRDLFVLEKYLSLLDLILMDSLVSTSSVENFTIEEIMKAVSLSFHFTKGTVLDNSLLICLMLLDCTLFVAYLILSSFSCIFHCLVLFYKFSVFPS